MFRVRSGNNGVRCMSLYILAVYKVLARSVSGNRLLGLWYQICMIRCMYRMTSNACNFHINSIVIYNSWYLKNLPSLPSKDSTDFAETTHPGRTFHTSTILLKKTSFSWHLIYTCAWKSLVNVLGWSSMMPSHTSGSYFGIGFCRFQWDLLLVFYGLM